MGKPFLFFPRSHSYFVVLSNLLLCLLTQQLCAISKESFLRHNCKSVIILCRTKMKKPPTVLELKFKKIIFIVFQNTGNILNSLFHLYKIKQQGTISNNMIKAMPLQFLFKHFHKQDQQEIVSKERGRKPTYKF